MMISALTSEVQEALDRVEKARAAKLVELRFRRGQAVRMVFPWGEELLTHHGSPIPVTEQLLGEMVDRATGFSPYACKLEETGLYLPLEGGYTRVRLLCQSPDDRHALHIAEIHVLGEGEVPSWVQQWKVFSGKADMVLLITDPGDEYIYFGGLLPYYAAQGKEIMLCVAVNTNSAYKCELLDGLWHCGITNYPYIAYFKPNLCRSLRAQYDTWSEVQFVRHVSRIVRIYKPDVLVTHSVGGEGGDGGHMACADAAKRSVHTAMDDKYDVGYGVKLYGNWQLKKLYLHNQDDNMITLDYNQQLDFFGGKTAMEVAQEAYAMQSYQRKNVPQLRTDGFYNGAVYGLAYSNVGEDTVGGDMFENLED